MPVRARGLLFPFPPLIDMEELLRLRLPRRAPMPDLGLRREAFCISAVRSERCAKTCIDVKFSTVFTTVFTTYYCLYSTKETCEVGEVGQDMRGVGALRLKYYL